MNYRIFLLSILICYPTTAIASGYYSALVDDRPWVSAEDSRSSRVGVKGGNLFGARRTNRFSGGGGSISQLSGVSRGSKNFSGVKGGGRNLSGVSGGKGNLSGVSGGRGNLSGVRGGGGSFYRPRR